MKPADIPDRDLAAILGVPEESLAATSAEPSLTAARRTKARRWPAFVLIVLIAGGTVGTLAVRQGAQITRKSSAARPVDATAARRTDQRTLAEMMVNDAGATSTSASPNGPTSTSAPEPLPDARLAAELTGSASAQISRSPPASVSDIRQRRAARDRLASARIARATLVGPHPDGLRPALRDENVTLAPAPSKRSESADERAARLDRLEALDAIRLLRQK